MANKYVNKISSRYLQKWVSYDINMSKKELFTTNDSWIFRMGPVVSEIRGRGLEIAPPVGRVILVEIPRWDAG